IKIGRELGLIQMEYMSRYNLGEMYYQASDLDAAWPNVNRAIELERRYSRMMGRPASMVLEARLLAFMGDELAARRVVAEVERHQSSATAENRNSEILVPSDLVLLAMVDLTTREATEDEWKQLEERSAQDSIEQEPIELLEMRGLSLLRRGLFKQA